MPTNLTSFKVFIASPGGLTDERRAFRDEIQDYNNAEAIPRGVLFQPFGWEDTLGGVGRPQSIINEDVRSSDFFVLLLWDRWGSAPDVKPSRFTSGTDEEYHVAMECYLSKDDPMRQLVLLFKAVDPKQLSDPGPQLEGVLNFKKEMEKEKTHLFHTFDTVERFQQLLRSHLSAWLRGWEKDSDWGKTPRSGDNKNPGIVDRESASNESASTAEAAQLVESSLSAKAWALADEGRLTEAEVEFARAIVGRQRPEDLTSYGEFLFRVGRLDQARLLFERAIEIASEDTGQDYALANAYGHLGSVLKVRGDLDEAEQMYRKSLEINEKLGRVEGMAKAYGNLGFVLRTRGDLDGAEEVYRKSLEIDLKLGHLEGIAKAHRNLGGVLYARGDLDGAERMLRESLRINEKLGRLEGMAKSYGNLGIVMQARGNLDGAEEVYRKALQLNEKLGRLEGMANAFGNLGNVLWARGDLDAAEQMSRKSLEIDEKLCRLEGMANSYGNLGNVLFDRGDLDGAEKMHRKSLEIDEKLRRLDGVAKSYSNLGNVLRARHDLDGAEQMHRKALQIDEKLGRLEGIAIDYGNLGNVLHDRNDLDGAEQLYIKSLEIDERFKRLEGMAIAYRNVGNVRRDKGDLEGAEQMFRKSLATAESLGSSSLITHAQASLDSLSEK